MRVHLLSVIARAAAAAGKNSSSFSTTTGLVSEISEVTGVSGSFGVRRAVGVNSVAGQSAWRRGFASVAAIEEDHDRPLWTSAAKSTALAESAIYKGKESISSNPSNPSHRIPGPWILPSTTPPSPGGDDKEFQDFMIVPKIRSRSASTSTTSTASPVVPGKPPQVTTVVGKKSEKEADLQILRTLSSYLWPDDNPEFRRRVLIALGLLVGSKVQSGIRNAPYAKHLDFKGGAISFENVTFGAGNFKWCFIYSRSREECRHRGNKWQWEVDRFTATFPIL